MNGKPFRHPATTSGANLKSVIWVPDAALRALQPDETYGAAEILESLDEWDPVKWGLPKSVSAQRYTVYVRH